MRKLLLMMIGLMVTSAAFAETPKFLLDSPSWCHGIVLTEVGKMVTLQYCHQHGGPRCTHVDYCNPDFGTIHRDEFIFSHEDADRIVVKMNPQAGPSIPEVACCSSKEIYVETMTIKPSVSRAYDPTVNTPNEMCSGFFGPNWHVCAP